MGKKDKLSVRKIQILLRFPVRVKGGMSLRNGMWHGLRNGIIMQNVKYGQKMAQRNTLN